MILSIDAIRTDGGTQPRGAVDPDAQGGVEQVNATRP
jgi:hypothetical protein